MVIWVVKIFFVHSSVYSCQLFLISSASVRSILFLSFIVPIFAWNVPLVSLIFLKRSLVFSFLLFSSISLHWSLRKAFLSLLAILWNSAFGWMYFSFSPLPFACLLFSAIYKASSENHFAFLHFFFLGMVRFQILMSWPSFFNLTSGGFLVAPPLISQPLEFVLWGLSRRLKSCLQGTGCQKRLLSPGALSPLVSIICYLI